TLSRLHAVDVDAVGLSDFARRDGYLARQLKRWHTQFTQSTLDGVPGPAVVDRVHELLCARIPEQQATAIVHGDYRLDNTVLDDAGEVLAILDWEICTLGDPLADLGLLLVYWAEPGDEASLVGVAPTTLPGFCTRAELLDRYARSSGLDVSGIAYYRAFGFWKLACILQGVHVRYASGAPAGDRSGAESFADHVGRLGERALAEVESL
ncbi:MAG TPA: phosphotransferase family protein, partial [Acidimicrobiales bacterium]|nr:phosphotransferase family protein [Acidimicrobiales bacterium]